MKYFDVNYSTDDRKSAIKIIFQVLKNLWIKDTYIISDQLKVSFKTEQNQSFSQYHYNKSGRHMILDYHQIREHNYLTDEKLSYSFLIISL